MADAALRIALRYLFSKKSHGAVNVISLISMAGVAVATAAIVCVLSVFNGFADLAHSRLSVIDPELMVTPVAGKTISDADSIALRLCTLEEVDTAVATIREQALAIAGKRQMAVDMVGVPAGYTRVVRVHDAVIDGEYDCSVASGKPAATLSVGSAIKLALRPYGTHPLRLYVPRRKGRINPSAPLGAFRDDSVWVSGVYEIDETEKDASSVLVPMATARELLEYDTEASAIEVALKPGIDPVKAQDAIKSMLGCGYSVKTRLEQEARSFKMIQIEKWITFVMLAFILLIASFNVISTLSMLIIEKRPNMVTLMAMGATRSMIRSIFMWTGWMISVIGGLTGLLLGVVLCLVQQYFGLIKLSGDASQLSLTVYPVHLAMGDLVLVGALVTLTGLFISALTSRFAR